MSRGAAPRCDTRCDKNRLAGSVKLTRNPLIADRVARCHNAHRHRVAAAAQALQDRRAVLAGQPGQSWCGLRSGAFSWCVLPMLHDEPHQLGGQVALAQKTLTGGLNAFGPRA